MPEDSDGDAICSNLAEALQTGDRDEVRAALADLKALSSKTRAGTLNTMLADDDATLLHIAAGEGDLHTVRTLINLGADIEAIDDAGDTPLQTALASIYFHQTDSIAMLLLDRNANCLEPDRYALTPLHHAAAGGSGALVDALIRAGADVNCSAGHDDATPPLHAAAEDGNASAARILLAAGAEIETIDADGRTALMLVVEYGQREVAKLLIDAGCNVDCTDHRRQTPLHFAARYGEDDLVKELIAAGANPLASDERGQTPQQILQVFDQADLIGGTVTGSPSSLDKKTRTAILRTVLFQNRPGWEDYTESSFAGMLHEKSFWMVNRCARVKAAIAGLGDRQDEPLDRSLASAAFTFFADAMNSIAAHQNPDDGFFIRGIEEDSLHDEYWDLRSVLDGFFHGRNGDGV